jgi:hypothetical protein
MKKSKRYLSALTTAVLAVILFAPTARAQNAADQAAQVQQQAAQQAQQAAQQTAQDATSSSVYIPSQIVPPPEPLQPAGPVQARIAFAHNILLTSVGTSPNFPIDSGQIYNDITAGLQSWGHYNLVSSQDQADLIFQLRAVAPVSNLYAGHGYVYSTHSPAFILTIVEPKTQLTLWTITSPVYFYGKKQVFAHWIALSVANLVSRIKVVAGQPLSTVEQADLTTVPKTHYGRDALIASGALIAAGVAGGLILHHEYENSLEKQKEQQDAFCTANHIPLDMCAGG